MIFGSPRTQPEDLYYHADSDIAKTSCLAAVRSSKEEVLF